MIYLDNAATSRFKPESVFNAVKEDLEISSNSGRSGHKDALAASLKIENCRRCLLERFGAESGYNIVFTKNCTEALNLAIFGGIKDGGRVLTTANEHNSVLRPLYELKRQNRIRLFVVGQMPNGSISPEHIKRIAEHSDFAVINAVSNVTGAQADIDEIGKIMKGYGARLVIDGSQAVPITPINMSKQNIDMLACPGHKGLHGVQGTGFLIFRDDLKLKPILFGGTGTSSSSTYQPTEAPEAYESGTLFAGGIDALQKGAEWSFGHSAENADKINKLASQTVYGLKHIGANVYCTDITHGVISFNLADADSGFIADKLDERDIAVRSGLHCAPLVHRFLKTEKQGAVRVSLGVDNTEADVIALLSALENIAAKSSIKL